MDSRKDRNCMIQMFNEKIPVYLPQDTDVLHRNLSNRLFDKLLASDNFYCMEIFEQIAYKVLNDLRNELRVKEFDELLVTAVGEPSDFCINKNILHRYEHQPAELNSACRINLRCKKCQYYINLLSPKGAKPNLGSFLPDIEETVESFSKLQLCPYYGLNLRMESSDLILTTNEALKESLRGTRLLRERLILNNGTILLIGDLFAMERIFESCFNFYLTPDVLRKAVAFMNENFGLISVYYRVEVDTFNRTDFACQFKKFVNVLEILRRMLLGEISVKTESSRDRLKVVRELGLPAINPSCCQIFSTAMVCCYEELSGRLPLVTTEVTLSELNQVCQFIHNLISADVANLIFSPQNEHGYFRFWHDADALSIKSEREKDNPNLKVFKFFSVSTRPALNALRSRGVKCLIGLGAVIPKALLDMSPDLITVNLPLESYQSNIFVALFSKSPGRNRIDFNFQLNRRSDVDYRRALGAALCVILSTIPDNVLLIFPSRKYYDSCFALWSVEGSANRLGFHVLPDAPCLHGNEPVCNKCISLMEKRQRDGQSVVAFARSADLEGVMLGFQAVVAVALPYKFFLNMKIDAKSAYLEKTGADPRRNWYTQETVNALVSPFLKATSLDPLAAKRGRILILLDTRCKTQMEYFPVVLQRNAREFVRFEDGVVSLKNFIRSFPAWEVPEGNLIDSGFFVHLRRVPFWLDSHDNYFINFFTNTEQLVEAFNGDANIDVFAARLVDLLHVESLYEKTGFMKDVLPWLVNCRHYLRNYDHQRYWPTVIKNLISQILQTVNSNKSIVEKTIMLPTPPMFPDTSNTCPVM